MKKYCFFGIIRKNEVITWILEKLKLYVQLALQLKMKKMLLKMFDASMNVARLNFSYGTHEESLKRIELIIETSKLANKHIGIMLDKKGQKIRVGNFENGSCTYKKGDEVLLFKIAMK